MEYNILNDSLEIWEIDDFYKNMRNYKKGYVYAWYNKTNKKIYIGSSSRLCGRFSNYYRAINGTGVFHSIILKRVFEKYIKNDFLFLILEKVENGQDCIKREQIYLDKYLPFGENGYNISKLAESCLGIKHSEESRKANSLRQQGEKSSNAKLKNEDIINIFNDYATNKKMTMQSIGKKYKISWRQIQMIIHREQWGHIQIDEDILQKVNNRLPVHISDEDAEIIGNKLKSAQTPKMIAKETGYNLCNINSINRGWTFSYIKEKLSPNLKYIYDFHPNNRKDNIKRNLIKEELKTSLSPSFISKKLGIPKFYINKVKKELNLQKPSKTISEEMGMLIGKDLISGLKMKEIMKKHNISGQTLQYINEGKTHCYIKKSFNPNGKFIKTPLGTVIFSDIKKMVKLIKNETKTKIIMKILGLSRSFIDKWRLAYNNKHIILK